MWAAQAPTASGPAAGQDTAPCLPRFVGTGAKSFLIAGTNGRHGSLTGEQVSRHPRFEFIIYVSLEVFAFAKLSK